MKRLALFVGAIAGWVFLLHGFVSMGALIVLSLAGPALAAAGLYLAIGSARHAHTSPWYAGSFATGLLLLAGSALTLAPQAPDRLLATTPTGWDILEGRTDRFERAIRGGNARLAIRLARRGLGDPAPLDAQGRPLIHDVTDATLLGSLLDSGLDPDAADTDGWTLLMNTRDLAMTRVLLKAGADPNARQRGGYTVLMASSDKDPALIELLLQAGANARASDESVGRRDWLLVDRDPSALLPPSTVTLDRRPLSPGDVARLDIRIANPSAEDRLLDVEASLSTAVLFVGASHDGAIRNPARPAVQQAVRWPRLALPAHSQGRLELTIVARSDATAAGDLGVDVRVWRVPDPEPEVLTVSERLVGGPPPASTTSWTWIAALLIAVAAAILIVPLVIRRAGARDMRAVVRVAAAGSAMVCAGVGLALAWSMVQPLVAFDEAACTILDRRLQLRTTRSTSRGARSSTYAVPIVAVRIDRAGERGIATGFANDFATRSPGELRDFPLGASVRCWVDPESPARFTLVRRPAISGLVGTTMLAALTLILAFVAKGLAPPAPSKSNKKRAPAD